MSGIFTQFMVGAIALLVVVSAPAGDGVQIAISGFHAAADKIEPGEGWWGIFPAYGGWTLQPTTVTVEAVINPIDGDAIQKTATRIGISQKEDSTVILIRELPKASAGSLIALKPEDATGRLRPGTRSSFNLKSLYTPDLTELFGTGHVELKPGERYTQIRDYELHLMILHGRNTEHQVLIKVPELEGEEGPNLVWAGDLDRDGKLDLIADLSAFYMDTDLALFLSSAAKEGELVGLVARWKARGNC